MVWQKKDRLGLDNLRHDPVKPLDRIKIPPFMIFGILFLTFSMILFVKLENEEMDLEQMQKRNVLLAAKKTQEHIEMAENEVSP
jgi:hypothetical protein